MLWGLNESMSIKMLVLCYIVDLQGCLLFCVAGGGQGIIHKKTGVNFRPLIPLSYEGALDSLFLNL